MIGMRGPLDGTLQIDNGTWRDAVVVIMVHWLIKKDIENDLQSFDEAAGKYIQPPEPRKPLSGPYENKEMLPVDRQDFEFKIRERVILKTIRDKKGALEFSQPVLV